MSVCLDSDYKKAVFSENNSGPLSESGQFVLFLLPGKTKTCQDAPMSLGIFIVPDALQCMVLIFRGKQKKKTLRKLRVALLHS